MHDEYMKTADGTRRSGEKPLYVLRLQQRPDLPGLYDGLIWLSDNDVGGRVELFVRFPHGHAAQFTPFKLAEFSIIRKEEQFPMGFCD